jgi:hypothetical protein
MILHDPTGEDQTRRLSTCVADENASGLPVTHDSRGWTTCILLYILLENSKGCCGWAYMEIVVI